MNVRSQMASCAAELKDAYSTSVDDFVTVVCFLLDQLTVQLPIWKTYPDVEWRELMSPAQSVSAKPITCILSLPSENLNPKFNVPFKYQSIHLIAIQ